jgi:adenosylcobyric acid synthase
MALLPPADRRRVAGLVINKFRGDVSLLAPALRDVARRTRRRVLAVIPFLSRLDLPEEDAVALDARAPTPSGDLRVAIVRVPHIANFTDFAPLEHEPGVSVRYVDAAHELADVHLVILPGSKDTIADLRALKSEGFASALRAHVDRGGTVLGICGGYQMLGRVVDDPSCVESGGSEEGFGLLPIRTVLASPKVTRRVMARWSPDGPQFEAYEIHMGRTVRDGDVSPLFVIGDLPEGCASTDGRVRGTYLHGLFDSAAVRCRLLDWARDGRGAHGTALSVDARLVREAAYDRLADTLDEALQRSLLRDLLRS